MANPEMEQKARSLFRDALVDHYMDGTQDGHAVEEWLRTHKGWFPDPQELYGDGTPLTQPVDEGESGRSSRPVLAMEDARTLINLLIASPDYEDDFKVKLQAWVDEDASHRLEHHLDSTSTVGMLGSSNGSRSRSRSRSRDASPSLETTFHRRVAHDLMDHQRNVRRIYAEYERTLRQIEVDRVSDERILMQVEERMNTRMNLVREDTSEWPVLVGPGLFNGQQNRIERVAEHQFTGTAHRLQ